MDFPGVFGDHIMPDKIHQLNVSFLVDTLEKQRGGTAGNIAYNLALLKSSSSIFAAAGNDFNEYAIFLKQNGIDTSNIEIIKDKPTASAFIMTDKNDNQISAFYPGAMRETPSLSLKGIQTDFAIISPNDPKAMVKFAKEATEKNIPYMMDPGMQLPVLNASDLTDMVLGAHILIGNDYEIDLLKKKSSLSEKDLFEQKVEILITTLGANGSQIKTKGETFAIKPAKPKEVVDPTGAGDAYRAGFMAGFLRGLDVKTCGQMGSVAASFAIEKYGTQQHHFTIQTFQDRYVQAFGDMIELEK